MAVAEYDTFVERLEELPEGREVVLAVRDLTPGRYKYESRVVRAILSSRPEAQAEEKSPKATGGPGIEGDRLWVRLDLGRRHPQPWAIKVLAVVGEYLPREALGWRT